MRVEIDRRGRRFLYRLHPDADDPDEGRRGFGDRPDPFLLVHREYQVVLPRAFRAIHPDVHAVAIWFTLRPVVGSRLELPFAVSTDLADWMRKRHGVRLERVDERRRPRRRPGRVVPALRFSGGMDSMAASLLLPPRNHHLFLDRIPRLRPHEKPDALIDQARQREACRAVRGRGAPVHIVADDHEHLFVPYPMWHSEMSLLPALYLADSLGLRTIDSGDVLDAKYFRGYHAGEVRGWRMRPPQGFRAGSDPPFAFLEILGLGRADSIAGLSEVATTAIVARSPYRDRSFSCYYPADGAFCMRCDKCFKKLLLRHVVEDREVPEALFEHFLAQPHLAAIFRRPYFDWHHVWYYLFQRLRCRHWFVRELQRQARRGPDLSCLEKWYPKARIEMEPAYADEVLARIGERVATMSAEETARLEACEVPPLEAPPAARRRARIAAVAPAVPPSDPPFPSEIKALYRLLRTKLPVGPEPRWGPYRLDDVFLRAGDPAVLLWLSVPPGAAVPPAGPSVVARLFRIGPRSRAPVHARLGSLGLFVESSGPVEAGVVRALVESLRAAFAEAAREIRRPAPRRTRRP